MTDDRPPDDDPHARVRRATREFLAWLAQAVVENLRRPGSEAPPEPRSEHDPDPPSG